MMRLQKKQKSMTRNPDNENNPADIWYGSQNGSLLCAQIQPNTSKFIGQHLIIVRDFYINIQPFGKSSEVSLKWGAKQANN